MVLQKVDKDIAHLESLNNKQDVILTNTQQYTIASVSESNHGSRRNNTFIKPDSIKVKLQSARHLLQVVHRELKDQLAHVQQTD